MMEREEILKELNKFRTLDYVNYSTMSDKQLKLRLEILMTMEEEGDKLLK